MCSFICRSEFCAAKSEVRFEWTTLLTRDQGHVLLDMSTYWGEGSCVCSSLPKVHQPTHVHVSVQRIKSLFEKQKQGLYLKLQNPVWAEVRCMEIRCWLVSCHLIYEIAISSSLPKKDLNISDLNLTCIAFHC